MSTDMQYAADRGCVFYSFGEVYALRLLVALYSLRQVYDGPVTTFLVRDATGTALQATLEGLGSDVVFRDNMFRSCERHRLFRDSPYKATLVLDSDMIFVGPIDELWAPLEREGLLVTRFFGAAYGIEGTKERPGWANRMKGLQRVRDLVDPQTYAEAIRRLCDEGIDVNVGVMGIARPKGERFLDDFSARMERRGFSEVPLLDELLTLALLPAHQHFLAEERWNCPADEFFRRTNLADARIIHYFADGKRVFNMRIGRNPATWAGKKWYEMYFKARQELDLTRWQRGDPTFSGRWQRLTAHGTGRAVRKLRERLRELLT